MSTETIDLDARYTVDGWGGIAVYLLGYVEWADEDTEWSGVYVEDRDWVRAVMVGDDRVHEVEVRDLTPLADDDYCSECGQVGCTHDGRERAPECPSCGEVMSDWGAAGSGEFQNWHCSDCGEHLKVF